MIDRHFGGTLARSTSRDFRHGPDVPLTRTNIQLEQLAEGAGPLTPEEVVGRFIHFPKARHYRRAYRLMTPASAAV